MIHTFLQVISNWSMVKSNYGFPWISAQPLLDPLLNMHTASYMSVITKGHASNQCPKRGLLTTGGQFPIEKHYCSLRIIVSFTYQCFVLSLHCQEYIL